jgi:hypothetical protein
MSLRTGPSAPIVTSTKTASYTLTNEDADVYFNTTSGACTATLPASPINKQEHSIKKVGGSSNEMIVSGNGNKIEGSLTYTPRTGATVDNVLIRLRYSSDSNSLGWWEI